MAKTYRVTLKYPDGTTMFMGTAHAEEIIEIRPKDTRPTNGHLTTETGERMTDPQKRYPFRLLGAQGTEGRQAEAHLKDTSGSRASPTSRRTRPRSTSTSLPRTRRMRPPAALSASAIQLYLTCSLKCRFQYWDRLPRLAVSVNQALGFRSMRP